MSIIACIGSRTTPSSILRVMSDIGRQVVEMGHIIASGNAVGADQAWVRGANEIHPERVHLYLPWDGYEWKAVHDRNRVVVAPEEWEDRTLYYEAARYHDAWPYCSSGAKKLLARNIMIVRPADLVLCYLNHKKVGGGGTGHGVRWSKDNGVRVVDLSQVGAVAEAISRIEGLGD